MVGIAAAAASKSLLWAKSYSFNPQINPQTGNRICSNDKSVSICISMVPRAKNREAEDDATDDTSTKFSLNISSSSSKLIIQSAVSLVAFMFVDAGYSGDWSRIGAISKETEQLCKNLTFVVVPLSIFLIYSLSRKGQKE